MDRMMKYVYAVGSMEDLREGNLNSIPHARTIRELELDLSFGEVIIPRFVGVYQKGEIIVQTPEEKRDKAEINATNKLSESIGGLISGLHMLVHGRGVDEFNHQLIHIAYDKSIWPDSDSIRKIYTNLSPRIKISSIEELPDFYSKDVTSLSKIIHDAFEQIKKGDSKYSAIKRLESEIRKLHEDLSVFGFTRQEYSIIEDMRENSEDEISC